MSVFFLKRIGKTLYKKISRNGLLTIFRHTWHAFAAFLVILAIIFTLFRALTPWVKHYHLQIQQRLSTWLGQEVAIRDVETSWYWFTPVLKLNQIRIGTDANHLNFDQVMVGVNLLSSLLHRHIDLGVLYVDNAHFKVRQEDGKWRVEGITLSNTIQEQLTSTQILPWVSLLLAQDKVIMNHIFADLFLEDGTHLVLRNLHFKSSRHGQNYRIYSKARIQGKPDIEMAMLADMTLDGPAWRQLSGQIYFSLSKTELTELQKLFPQMIVQIKQGSGSVEAWMDVKHGRVATTQASVQLDEVHIQEPKRNKLRKLRRLTANCAWQRTSKGWRFTVDQLFLHADGIMWPENAFLLEYRNETQDYHALVKTLPLKSLLQADLPWPKEINPILDLKPKGFLSDTEISWQHNEIHDFLTRFSHLSWRAKNEIPGVTELSGVIYWQPTEGRLEMNGSHSVISMHKPLAPVDFDTLSLSLDWKYLSQGWRVSVDRLVLSHPNLVLSAVGAIDDPGGPNAHLRLQMDFSAKEGQVWLPYIPTQGLKPKLDAWLKKDIPHIGRASGRLRIVGSLEDFPFEHQNGEFSLNAHLNDVDMLIDQDWPVNANMDADIHVNSRNFTADVHQGNLYGVIVNQVNIAIPDIGLGKEKFLLHGKIHAPAEKIKSYLLSSPLKSRFERWKNVTISDFLDLDLNLEVPLYPEADHVFAKGELGFNQNLVSVDFADNPAELVGVEGRLDFNEYGVTSGGLDGTVNQYPFSIRAQPLVGPKQGTELKFDGELDMSYIQHLIHYPIFSFMNGRCIVNGLWTIYPEAADKDRLEFNSSLVGLAIHLPPPFGKSLSSIAPTQIKIDFSPNKRINFDVNYAQQLTGIFAVQPNAQQSWIATGSFHVGEGRITKPNKTGLSISGSLAEVNLNTWQTVLNKWPKTDDSVSLLANLKEMNLDIDKVVMADSIYRNLQFMGHQISPSEWSFHLRQKDISGDFGYNWQTHTFSAYLGSFNLETLQSSNSAANKWQPKLEDIPNLNIKIDSLNFREIEIGKLSLNTTTKSGHWFLNKGELETPEYKMVFKGDWVQQDNKNASSIEAELHLSHLGNALARWHITPVIDAHYGYLTFAGKWPSAIYAGSLKTLNGNMNLVVKDGHISHLDRDTEKKLGLGKLLSILSLQTIPRRLKLDFSDLSQKGYTFDQFKGNFKIYNGVMSTEDSSIDGPVAFGRMSGDLDLVNQLYDLDLIIYPYITASLPVVASIVGSPVAGVAVWAVSSLASKGMQKISGYTYKISGPWLNPVVQQVSIDKSAR